MDPTRIVLLKRL